MCTKSKINNTTNKHKTDDNNSSSTFIVLICITYSWYIDCNDNARGKCTR